MPELPEVETTRRGLAPALVGRTIASVELRRPDLRFPFQNDFRRRIEGRRVERLDRRAKYLIARLAGGEALVAHLGMSGSFRVEAEAPLARLHRSIPRLVVHDHVVLHLSDGARIVYNDPRRFGFMFVVAADELAVHPRMQGIGLEPLDPSLDAQALASALAGSATSLKAALLDQKRIAGLGNIYVCEALHRARLSPTRSAGDLARPDRNSRAAAKRLAQAIRDVLNDAIEAGGSSLRDFSGVDGKPGYFQHTFSVYDREGERCPRKDCAGVIVRRTQAGRSTFSCESCQS